MRDQEKARARRKRWKAKNREKVRAAWRRWHAAHRSQRTSWARAWRAENPEKVRAAKRRDYDKNRERYLQKAKAWRESNLEYARAYDRGRRGERRAYNRLWRARNRDRVLLQKRAEYERNPQPYRDRARRNRLERLTPAQWKKLAEMAKKSKKLKKNRRRK